VWSLLYLIILSGPPVVPALNPNQPSPVLTSSGSLLSLLAWTALVLVKRSPATLPFGFVFHSFLELTSLSSQFFGSILGVLAVEICHFLLETPPFLFQFSGCVLVVSQWKFCSLFPLRQRIVVAMESRRDELCFVGCSSY
jgi:hypothetical protein